MWEIFDTGCQSAGENMKIDADLLATLEGRQQPILRLYDWQGKCATYGYLTKPEQYLNLQKVDEEGVSLARRPTGGGIVFHIWDLAFSVLVPAHCPLFSQNTLANYALVNNTVQRAVEEFAGGVLTASIIAEDALALDASCKRFCMAQPTKYDVVWNGFKIAGAAQRQTKMGFLHQGTISLKTPDLTLLENVLLPGSRVLEAMKANTFTLLPEGATDQEYQEARNQIKQLLSNHFVKL